MVNFHAVCLFPTVCYHLLTELSPFCLAYTKFILHTLTKKHLSNMQICPCYFPVWNLLLLRHDDILTS